ncbi:hypothetical protein QA635_23120 [Bradyrhizobium brasilense]|uniref:hypothetical protein n=1 Tax=Bradyrhizobium brasilense TaxID=1419277 RepID=UPI0024B1A036|nr:hypothetical protein [Bradyrhizobium australafricanum]WFU29505.1 hypothetical protein QA635_23120 [Bradyrhizobium australafricanum]
MYALFRGKTQLGRSFATEMEVWEAALIDGLVEDVPVADELGGQILPAGYRVERVDEYEAQPDWKPGRSGRRSASQRTPAGRNRVEQRNGTSRVVPTVHLPVGFERSRQSPSRGLSFEPFARREDIRGAGGFQGPASGAALWDEHTPSTRRCCILQIQP